MVATHPLDCKQQATVAVKCLTPDTGREKRGKSRPLVDKVRPTIKYNLSLLYENSFLPWETGLLRGFPLVGIKAVKSFLMLCQTRIVFSDEYPEMGIPNRATANDTRSPNYNGIPFSLGISLALNSILTSQRPKNYGFCRPVHCRNSRRLQCPC